MTGARVSRGAGYALLGGLLSAGAPLGLLLLRLLDGGVLSIAWLGSELARDATYLYVAASTTLVFSLFGYLLGRQADALLVIAETEPLTGLKNTRVFRERLQQEAARAARYGTPLSLLLLDLDGLKQINDRHGHAAGDAALRRVAEVIQGQLRGSDVGARWGGDEFALLAPSTGERDGIVLAERLRGRIEGSAGAPRAGGAITVSIGIATADPARSDEPDAAALMDSADGALYDAKRAGRNCVRARQLTAPADGRARSG